MAVTRALHNKLCVLSHLAHSSVKMKKNTQNNLCLPHSYLLEKIFIQNAQFILNGLVTFQNLYPFFLVGGGTNLSKYACRRQVLFISKQIPICVHSIRYGIRQTIDMFYQYSQSKHIRIAREHSISIFHLHHQNSNQAAQTCMMTLHLISHI